MSAFASAAVGMNDTLTGLILDALRPEIERLVDERVDERVRAAVAQWERRMADPWMTTERAAAYLSLTPDALRARVRRGTIPAHRDGDRWLFHRDELDAHVRGLHPAATIVAATDNRVAPRGCNRRGRGTERMSFDA
jgi:excisionase family DNA binding protein